MSFSKQTSWLGEAIPEVKINLSAGVTVIIPERVLVLAAQPNALPRTVKLYSNVCSWSSFQVLHSYNSYLGKLIR